MKEKTIKLFKLITGIAHRELKEERDELLSSIERLHETKEGLEEIIKDLHKEMIIKDELHVALIADSEQFKKDRDYWKKQYEDAIKDRDERLLNKDRIYNELIQTINEENLETHNRLDQCIEKLKAKLADKEAQRRKTVGEKTKIKNQLIKSEEEKVKLLEQIDFLKSHRRAPDLQEVKDYTYGRKRKKCEKTS